MSLAVSLFLLVFVTELIAWIGKSVLLDLCYGVYGRVFNSKKVADQRKLKSDILAAKAELLQTSAQDQFAKWAKLRRKVDKELADLEKLNGELGSARSSFSMKFNSFLWLLTTGVQFGLGWWYRKSAVFYLPPNWLGPVTWWLALPFAPAGSVSCGAWQMVCKRVIKMGEQVVRDFAVTTPTEETTKAGKGAKAE